MSLNGLLLRRAVGGFTRSASNASASIRSRHSYIACRHVQNASSRAGAARPVRPASARWNACECTLGIAGTTGPASSVAPSAARPGVTVAIDGGGQLKGEPAILLQGLPVEEDRDDFLDEARDAAAGAATKGDGKGGGDEAKLREAIRLAVRRRATAWTGKKPVVEVSIIRV